MKKLAVWAILSLLLLCGCAKTDSAMSGDFSFSLVWGANGSSSYDMDSGVLVKSNVEPEAEKYRTVLHLTEEQRAAAWEAVAGLDWSVYSEIYDPNMGLASSSPTMDLILTVTENGRTHVVRCLGIAIMYDTHDENGQAFLDACLALENLIMDTPEWQALPDYTVFFE